MPSDGPWKCLSLSPCSEIAVVNENELIELLHALCSLDGRSHIPVGRIRVKYRGDDVLYPHWVPKKEHIVADGLLDPGFTSGPCYYADIDQVEVRLWEWVAEKGQLGGSEFAELREMLADQPGLEVGKDVVAWRNSDLVAVDLTGD